MNEVTKRLEQVEADYKKGRMSFENMEWLMTELRMQNSLALLLNKRLETANENIQRLTKMCEELESDGRSNR